MNANLSPLRRGFSVPRETPGNPQIEFMPRLDMLSLEKAEEQAKLLGKKRQKLPAIMKLSPRSRIRVTTKGKAAGSELEDFILPSSTADLATSEKTDESMKPRRRINQKRGKRVHFHRNERGRIVVTALGPQKRELTAVETKKVWWSRNDLKRFRERAQEACRRIMNAELQYKSRLVYMLDHCGAEHKVDFDEGMAKLGLDRNLANETLEEMCAAIVSEDGELARGLEKRILNAMDVPFHRHRKSAQTVLAIQSCLDQQNAKHLSNDRKAMLIASQYQISSQYAAVWAQEIAIEDAKTAHSMLQI